MRARALRRWCTSFGVDCVTLKSYVLFAYAAQALTVHKTQALSIKHTVLACLEGVFAQGHVYVMVSRVTDPANFALCGLPPKDLVDDVAAALRESGEDIDDVFQRACTNCNEHVYDPCRQGAISDRFAKRYQKERTISVKHRYLAETLNPQPRAFSVIHRLLSWIDRCDEAAQRGEARPPFVSDDGSAVFPPGSSGDEERLWWLTDVKRKQDKDKDADGKVGDKGDEDGPPESDVDEDQDPKPADALTSDSDADPEQLDDDGLRSQSQTVRLPLARSATRRKLVNREPIVAWRLNDGPQARTRSFAGSSDAAGHDEDP